LCLGPHAELACCESHAWIDEAVDGQKSLVFLHGVMCCALQAKVGPNTCIGCSALLHGPGWENTFFSAEELVAGVPRFRNVLKLRKTRAKRTDGSEVVSTCDQEGVQIRPYPGIAGIATLNPGEDPLEIPVFKVLIRNLAPNYRLQAASYDWRRWGDVVFMEKTAEDFKRTIEREFKLTGRSVAIIAHSMGGNVAVYCMNTLGDDWCRKHVSDVILVAPSLAGSCSMLYGFANAPLSAALGTNFPDFVDNFVADCATTFPVGASLLPTQVGQVQAHDVDHKFVVTPDRTYGVEDMGQFVADMESQWPERVHTAEFWPHIEAEARRIAPLAAPTHIVYMDHVDTPCQITYESSDLRRDPVVSQRAPGDGTLIVGPLKALAAAWGRAGKAPVAMHRLPGDVIAGGVNHGHMIMQEWLVQLIEDLVPPHA